MSRPCLPTWLRILFETCPSTQWLSQSQGTGTQSALGRESKEEWSLRPRPLTYRSCLTTSYSARGITVSSFWWRGRKNKLYRIRPFKTRSACPFCHVLPRCKDVHPFGYQPCACPVNPLAPILPCLGVPHPFSDSLFRARLGLIPDPPFAPPLPGSLSQPPTGGAQYLIYYLRPIISSKKRGTGRPDLLLPCLPPPRLPSRPIASRM